MTGRVRDLGSRGTVTVATVAAIVGLALSGCGSGESESDPAYAPEPAAQTPTGRDGTYTPERSAPESAGDRRPDAPDRVITERPGGGASPAAP